MDRGATTSTRALLQKTLNSLVSKAEFPVAFGGLVGKEGALLSSFVGTNGPALHGLVVEPNEGLGGRAMVERRPLAATQYLASTAISHRYDREVVAEGLVSVMAIPVIVDGSVRAVVYGAHRTATQLGDAVLRTSVALAGTLAFEYAVHDEVERRIAVLQTEGAAGTRRIASKERTEVRELYAELRELSRTVDDARLSGRLASFGEHLGARSGPAPVSVLNKRAAELSPRELDVLANVALGKRNALIGGQLCLAESTVKSYLSSAMRKLDASNRYEAVITARQLGLIP